MAIVRRLAGGLIQQVSVDEAYAGVSGLVEVRQRQLWLGFPEGGGSGGTRR